MCKLLSFGNYGYHDLRRLNVGKLESSARQGQPMNNAANGVSCHGGYGRPRSAIGPTITLNRYTQKNGNYRNTNTN